MFDEFGSDICIVMSDGYPMSLSSVWLGNMYECRHKLISAQFGNWKSHLNLGNEFPNPTVKIGENPALDYTFPVHFLYIYTLILHLTYETLVQDQGTF